MEIIICLLLIAIVLELALLLYRKEQVEKVQSRRETYGVFANPLADKYRKNSDGLYRPVRPYRGDDKEDEV